MWVWWLLISVVSAYHTTDKLLSLAETHCHGPMTCRHHEDILLLDWDSPSEDRVLLVFNEHARERITGELALALVEKIHEWQPQVDVTIIPVLNVWGRKYVEHGHPCQRKNSRGVDTNRNYQMAANRHHYLRQSEEYEGPSPLSEKESKLVSNELVDVKKYVNIHSGEFSLYQPYDSRLIPAPHYQKMRKQLEKWSHMCPKCVTGPAAKTSFYKAYGTSVDWAIDHGVSESYTFEIFGRETRDCDRMFNPVHIQGTLDMWLPILKDVLETF